MTKQDKVEKVMHEWKVGTLTSNGRKVTDYDQAVAIALSEAGLSKYEKNETMDKMNKGGLIDAPKIYVADLEAYNNGKLVGEWLDLSDFEDGKDVSKEISKLLKKWGAEEYAIHDVENVPSSMYSEYMGEEDFDKIIKIYKASEESDLPYEVISEIILQYEPEDLEEWISEHYEGHFDNDTDLAYSVVENMGSVSDLGEKTTEMYFDYEGFGRDLAINDEWEGDFDSDEDRGYDYVENMGGVSELGDKTIDMYFDYEKFGRDLAIDDYTEIEDGYYFRTPRYAKGGTTNKRKFAVGGEVGNQVSFKGDYGTPRSGIVKEKRGSSYIVATDDGDRLVDSYEVISFSEAPIEKKKRFGFFEGGGEMTKFAEGGLVKVTRGFYKGFEKFKDKIIIPLGISASKNGLDRYKMPKTSVGVGFQLAKKMKGMSYDTFHLAIKDDEIVLLLTPTGQRTIKINVELKNYTFQFVIDSVKESVNEYLKPSKYEGGGSIKKYYDVFYTIKGGGSMVSKNIEANSEEEAKEKLTKQMRASSSFDKPIAAIQKFKNGGWVLYDEDDERLIKVYETESEARKNLNEYDGNANIVEKSIWEGEKYEGGGEFQNENSKYLHSISEEKKSKILKNIASHYGISMDEAEEEVKDEEAEMLYEYIANDPSLRMEIYKDIKTSKYEGGGEIQSKIDKLNKVVNSKMLPEGAKTKAKAEIEKLEKQLHESKEKKGIPQSHLDLKSKARSKVDVLSFDDWMKENGITFYKRTYYWVADDGGADYMYSGEYNDVKKSLKNDWEQYKLAKLNVKMSELHESKETNAEEKEEHKPEVITDKADVQKIKNSIQEGESILKSGKINGRKLSEGELESTLNSVNKSRAKIGLPKSEAKEPKFKIGDVVGLDLDERTPKMITSFKTNRKGEIIYSGYYIPFPNEKWNYEESEIVLLKTPSKSEAKKPTTRKAPVKAKEKILGIEYTVGTKGHAKALAEKKHLDDLNKSETSKIEPKPKADHKKLLAKIKAKKGDKKYDNKASLNPETGERRKRSESSDKKREALPLGKRVSADGNTYYENRLNRADMNKEDKFEEGGEVKSSGWGLKFLKW